MGVASPDVALEYVKALYPLSQPSLSRRGFLLGWLDAQHRTLPFKFDSRYLLLATLALNRGRAGWSGGGSPRHSL